MTQPTGFLTTHVLDTARGRPAAGMRVELSRLEAGGSIRHIATVTTNADGRTDAPLIAQGALEPGEYELLFHAGEYLTATRGAADGPQFLDQIPIRFGLSDPDEHYHVPLLISPFAYSTYRGS